MNKTAGFITFATLAGIGILGTVALLVFAPESTDKFVSTLITLLGIVSVGAGTFASLAKVDQKISRVEAQTNGNLSRRDAEIERLTAENVELARQLNPETGAEHGQ